ncbi:MAG: hypothetical protein QCH99_01605 [Candidatus Bathyarchaeota archaeon]|nr:hypothetical protein [Candidatus Bathyarchaeum tardum]WGM89263.1 MAG: hypothetical protein NUK63_10175 [Candidatus Bathyarchaeum tardum]
MKTGVFASFFLLVMVLVIPLVQGSEEIDASTVVTEVLGDDSFETETEGTIKLADIDPTCADIDNSTGYISAKSVLASLVEGKTVYLDIDNLYGTDYTGTGNRTVAVVYVDLNSTHYLNVNYLLLEHKLLAINNQENDFNPDTWTSLVKKQDIPEFPAGILITVFTIVLITATTVLKKMNKNGL